MPAPSQRHAEHRPNRVESPQDSQRRRRFRRFKDRTLTVLKWVILPFVFVAGMGGVSLAGFYISFGSPWVKLAGFGLLTASATALVVGLWIALGRPTQWGRRR